MSLVSTEDFLAKGHQVDLDMMNLDSAIKGVHQEGGVPFADFSSWQALYSEWKRYYDTKIASVPWNPWQSTSDLDKWLGRIESWRAKNQKWALLSGSARARTIVAAMPESPATISYRENPPSSPGTPTWVWMAFGLTTLGVLGYTLGAAGTVLSAAKGMR